MKVSIILHSPPTGASTRHQQLNLDLAKIKALQLHCGGELIRLSVAILEYSYGAFAYTDSHYVGYIAGPPALDITTARNIATEIEKILRIEATWHKSELLS